MKDPQWHRLTLAEYARLLDTSFPFRSVDDSDQASGIVWVFGFADLMDKLNPVKLFTHALNATKPGYEDINSRHENATNAYITARQRHALGYVVQITEIPLV